MNPYDPNDALSDKSDEFSPTGTLTTIEEYPEECHLEELNVELERLRANIVQKSGDVLSGTEFSSGEVTSDDTNYEFKFNDPNNEIDSGKTSRESLKRKDDDALDEYDTKNVEVFLNEMKNALESSGDEESPPGPVEETGSSELIHLLEEAKTLFETPDKQKVRISEELEEKPKSLCGTSSSGIEEKPKSLCGITSSGMELLEIETKLRECHLVKSPNLGKQDVRLNQLTLKGKSSKPEETKQEMTSSELEIQDSDQAKDNFGELLYKSAFMDNIDDVALLQNIHKDQEVLKEQTRSRSSEDLAKPKQIDDYVVLSRAVQLLESRSSTQSVPENCRGILGILALQQKLKELFNDKEELENRLYKCNSDFTEFIDILSDKARIISINNKEVANFIKILNLKVPELEKITASHTESLEDIKYRFKERNVAKIIELRKQIEFYTSNIDKLKKKISKINVENTDIKRQMEVLDVDNLSYKTYFAKKVEEVRANMENLQSLNNELQHQLELIQNSDLGKNENFKLKVPSLKEEIENISNNIKEVRREKNKYELENTDLRKKLKHLILAKVMEKRSSGTSAFA